MVDEPTSEAPTLYATRVQPEWVDYNGHMSEAYYVLVFGYATDALLDEIGMDAAYRERSASSLYTLEAHVCYLDEVLEGQPIQVTTRVLGVDRKRVRVFHAMHRDLDLVATEELMMCHVDTAAGRSAALPQPLADALGRLRDAQRHLPVDARAGRSISLPD